MKLVSSNYRQSDEWLQQVAEWRRVKHSLWFDKSEIIFIEANVYIGDQQLDSGFGLIKSGEAELAMVLTKQANTINRLAAIGGQEMSLFDPFIWKLFLRSANW